MILLTVQLLKAFIILVFFVFLFYKCETRKNITNFIVVCVLVIFIVNVSDKVASVIPPLTDDITITALGDKNTASFSDEIVLLGIMVDEKNYEIAAPKEGKWFWGIHYMWRNKSDLRQPDNTTQAIVLSIPVGWERQITFLKDCYNGYVKVECLGKTQIIDTYSAAGDSVNVWVAGSFKKDLLVQWIINLAVFYSCFVVAAVLSWLVLKRGHLNFYRIVDWAKVHKTNLSCGTISLIMLAIMVHYSKTKTLWNDEIWQVWFSMENEGLFSKLFFSHSSYYPCLFDSLLSFLYPFMPYGEVWLVLPLEICTAAGVFIISMTVKKIIGDRASILSAALGAVSVNLIFQCGFEYRPYGFLFLACCITFYTYTSCRCQQKNSLGNMIMLGIALWLPAACHVFGVFFSAGLVLTDFIYILKKKITWKYIYSYIVAFLLYSPWLYNMLCYDVLDIDASWQGTPSLLGIYSLLRYLANSNSFILLLLLVGFFLSVIVFIDKTEDDEIVNVKLAPVVTLLFVFSFVYIYGRWLNPKAAMWISRYFIVLYPITIYFEALAADVLCSLINKKKIVLSVCAALLLNTVVWETSILSNGSPNGYQHFKDAANWLYTQQNEIYNDETLIVYAPDAPAAAWQEYYTTKQGLRDPLDVISQYSFVNDDVLGKNLVYVYYEHVGMLDNTREILENNGFYEVNNDEYLKIRTFIR